MTDNVSRLRRSEIMRAVRGRDTKPELLVKLGLATRGIVADELPPSLPGTPDIVVSSTQTVVLVHGCFWHGHQCARYRIPKTNRDYWLQKVVRNMARDRRVVRLLRGAGWRVCTVWECQLAARKSREISLNRLKGRISRQHL